MSTELKGLKKIQERIKRLDELINQHPTEYFRIEILTRQEDLKRFQSDLREIEAELNNILGWMPPSDKQKQVLALIAKIHSAVERQQRLQ